LYSFCILLFSRVLFRYSSFCLSSCRVGFGACIQRQLVLCFVCAILSVAVIAAIVIAIIFSIIRILFGVDLVQDTSKNPAAYLVQLFFYILGKFVADGSAFDNEYCSIADRTYNRAGLR